MITDPKDVELGTLLFMVESGNLSLGIAEYDKVKSHKEARNKLSYLTAQSIGEIKALV